MVANVHRADIAKVCSSKRDLHMFLTVEMGFYLPALPFTNMAWLSAIWQGTKKVSASVMGLIANIFL
jgi:hypothetical protein